MFFIRIFALLLVTFDIHAASFDCKQASTLVERIICENDDLSSLDEALSVVYGFESRGSGSSAVRAGQKSWMLERNRCTDTTCIVALYEQRITYLCNEGTQATGSAIGTSACASVLLRVAERELDSVERLQEKGLLKESYDTKYLREVITDERKAWKAYRDANCALWGESEGGIQAWKSAFASYCMVQETQDRIKKLNGK